MRPVRGFLAILACSLALAAPADAAPGDLDPSFSGDGLLTIDLGGFPDYDEATAVAVQEDGRIVLAGSANPELTAGSEYDFVVLRRNADGSPDTSFSGDGRATADLDIHDEVHAVAIAPGGEIVIAGSTRPCFNCISDPVLARFRSDGSPDTGFSDDGLLRLAPDPADVFDDVTVLPDNRIVAAGYAGTVSSDMVVRRLEPDGDPDMTFAGDGLQTVDFGSAEQATGLAIDPAGGRVVLAGTKRRTPFGSETDLALARLEPDGDLDPTFSGDGKLTAGSSGGDGLVDVALQSDGHIVAAGHSSVIGQGQVSHFLVVRYRPDGTLDRMALTDVTGQGDSAYALAVQPDDKFLVVGLAYAGGENYDFALARYQRTGELDPAFACDGTLLTDFGGVDGALAVALQPDGRAVVAGGTHAQTQDEVSVAVSRYLTDGARAPCPTGGGGTPRPPVVPTRPAVPAADVTAPRVAVRVVAIVKLRTLLRRGWLLRVSSSERGFASARLEIRRRDARRLKLGGRRGRAVVVARASGPVAAGTTALRLRATRAAQRRLKRARRLRATLRVTVSDRAGNRRRLSRRMQIRR